MLKIYYAGIIYQGLKTRSWNLSSRALASQRTFPCPHWVLCFWSTQSYRKLYGADTADGHSTRHLGIL